MKGLSLTQPWATLVSAQEKLVETRTWSTRHRGELAIHAAKGFPRACREVCRDEPFRSALERAGIPFDSSAPKHWYHVPYFRLRDLGNMPLGAIVAVVDVIEVVQTKHYALVVSDKERPFGDYAEGRYAWVLGNCRRLTTPVPCKGMQGIWTVDGLVERDVRKALL